MLEKFHSLSLPNYPLQIQEQPSVNWMGDTCVQDNCKKAGPAYASAQLLNLKQFWMNIVSTIAKCCSHIKSNCLLSRGAITHNMQHPWSHPGQNQAAWFAHESLFPCRDGSSLNGMPICDQEAKYFRPCCYNGRINSESYPEGLSAAAYCNWNIEMEMPQECLILSF